MLLRRGIFGGLSSNILVSNKLSTRILNQYNLISPFCTVSSVKTNDEGSYDESGLKAVKEGLKHQIRERKVDEYGRSYGTGRRKTSSARVFLSSGSGQVSINDRSIVDYFQFNERKHAMEPLELADRAGLFDVMCTVTGGGTSGQAGAIRLGVARALEAFEPTLRPLLKTHGLLTRDERMVERKKIGQKKARKKFQWVKR